MAYGRTGTTCRAPRGQRARKVDGDIADCRSVAGRRGMCRRRMKQAQDEIDRVRVDDEIGERRRSAARSSRPAHSPRTARSRPRAARTRQAVRTSPALLAASCDSRRPAVPSPSCVCGKRACELGAHFTVRPQSSMPCSAITGMRARIHTSERTREGRCAHCLLQDGRAWLRSRSRCAGSTSRTAGSMGRIFAACSHSIAVPATRRSRIHRVRRERGSRANAAPENGMTYGYMPISQPRRSQR